MQYKEGDDDNTLEGANDMEGTLEGAKDALGGQKSCLSSENASVPPMNCDSPATYNS